MGNVLAAEYTYDETTLDLGAQGKWRGTSIDGRVRRFTGVPYAAAPVEEKRWKRPQRLEAGYVYGGDGGGFDATKWGEVCPQVPFPGMMDKLEYGEDCLRVNVWMPAGETPHEGWPVMVWFHGGLLQGGNPCVDSHSDPTELISTQGAGLECIFIAVGYRVGVYGFLASDELAEEGECGNYGLWDQREALKWVERFAPAMGGDLTRVTLAGMSAGAYSVHAQAAHALMVDEKKGGFVKRLVLHSNAIPCNPKSLADVQPQFEELLAALDIPTSLSGREKLARLRALDAETLLKAVKGMQMKTFRPVADGAFFPEDMMRRFAECEFAREFERRGMKILLGEVMNEECTYRMDAPKEQAELRGRIANLYPLGVTDKLLKAYTEDKIQVPTAMPDPNPNISEVAKVYGDIILDGQVRAPERLLVQQLCDAGVPLDRVHRYRIGWKPDFVKQVLPEIMGVPHASDTLIWNYGVRHGPTEQEQHVMKRWIGDLVKFVHDEPFEYGTRGWREMKQLDADGGISIVEDSKWDYLLQVAHLMSATDATS